MLHFVALRCHELYCVVLHCVELHYFALFVFACSGTVLCCLYRVSLRAWLIALCCVALHCIALCYLRHVALLALLIA